MLPLRIGFHYSTTQLDTKCYAIPVIVNIYHRGWELNLDSDNLPDCMPLSSDTQFRMPKSNLKIIQTSHLVSNPKADYDEELHVFTVRLNNHSSLIAFFVKVFKIGFATNVDK